MYHVCQARQGIVKNLNYELISVNEAGIVEMSSCQ